MTREEVEHFRQEAEKCLKRAKLAPDEPTHSNLRFLADQWLKMAASAELIGETAE
jgi:hypothetical protein